MVFIGEEFLVVFVVCSLGLLDGIFLFFEFSGGGGNGIFLFSYFSMVFGLVFCCKILFFVVRFFEVREK